MRAGRVTATPPSPTAAEAAGAPGAARHPGRSACRSAITVPEPQALASRRHSDGPADQRSDPDAGREPGDPAVQARRSAQPTERPVRGQEKDQLRCEYLIPHDPVSHPCAGQPSPVNEACACPRQTSPGRCRAGLQPDTDAAPSGPRRRSPQRPGTALGFSCLIGAQLANDALGGGAWRNGDARCGQYPAGRGLSARKAHGPLAARGLDQ